MDSVSSALISFPFTYLYYSIVEVEVSLTLSYNFTTKTTAAAAAKLGEFSGCLYNTCVPVRVDIIAVVLCCVVLLEQPCVVVDV